MESRKQMIMGTHDEAMPGGMKAKQGVANQKNNQLV
jgi:hypothetical protein